MPKLSISKPSGKLEAHTSRNHLGQQKSGTEGIIGNARYQYNDNSELKNRSLSISDNTTPINMRNIASTDDVVNYQNQ